jgi:hypothetical protein
VKAAGHGTPMMGERESYGSFQWEAMRHDSISAGYREAWLAIDASAKVSSLERRKGSRSGLGRRSEWADWFCFSSREGSDILLGWASRATGQLGSWWTSQTGSLNTLNFLQPLNYVRLRVAEWDR